jgi:hypothetical protein
MLDTNWCKKMCNFCWVVCTNVILTIGKKKLYAIKFALRDKGEITKKPIHRYQLLL